MYIQDNTGEYDDWVELYNTSSTPVDISGFYLTDNMANLNKWKIPAGTIIPANGYLTFWADEDSSQGWNHMNFKLSASGEFVWLLNTNKEIVDSVTWTGAIPADSAYARIPNGSGNFIIKNPTHGYNNEALSAIAAVVAEPAFTIFPNPADNSVIIEARTNHLEDPLEISNAFGQVVYRQMAKGSQVINTSAWAPGVYMVKYHQLVRKFVIHH